MRRAGALLAIGLLLAGACSGSGDDADDAAPTTAAPTTAAPTTAAPAPTTTVDPAALEPARAYAFADGRNTQGVVVLQHGELVAEWYADGATADSYAASWSMAKSVTSALVGIAIDEGLIPGVDEPMSTWFPEWAADDRAAITLEDVLHMASGLDWLESYNPDDVTSSDIVNLVLNQPDELAYAASQSLRDEPGTRFNYSSGDAMLLSGVLEQATGMSAGDYAQQELFGPLGMTPLDWWQDAAGHTLTYCCIDTTSRNFARFGQLYLDGGVWEGQQVVPADWVEASLSPSPASSSYGYQWWLGLGGADYAAMGFDTQRIYVVLEHDLVVVRNGTYVKDPGPPVAAPNLFGVYPPGGFVPGRGTSPPNDWNDADFLALVIAGLT